MTLSAGTFVVIVVAAVYLLASSLLWRAQFADSRSPDASMPQRFRARILDVLLLPELLLLSLVISLTGLTGFALPTTLLVMASVGLALWIIAPGYVTSKIVPLALVGVGLAGLFEAKFVMQQWADAVDIQTPHYGFTADFHTGPTAVLVQAWAFIAFGLLLTWLRMDPRSRPSQILLREAAPARRRVADERSRRGRPRWGLALLLVAVLLSERLTSVLVWSAPVDLVLLMAMFLGAAAFLAFRFPAVAADLAIVGLIGFGLDGIEIARSWSSWGNVHPVAYGLSLAYNDRWAMMAAAQGVGLVAAGIWLLPRALDDRTRSLFRSTTDRELAGRVARLTRTRAEAVDSAAAELRRVERDLHDGAQARLVALGIILRGAERLIHDSPDAAAALVAEARESSRTALGELRDLVRGIRPPVLADRGLPDAVRALALDTPLHTDVDVDLPGRPDLAVESACYFAVAELLANAVKHSGARHVQVRVAHDDDLLRITVTDDGAGGADPSRGSGLAGLERRFATFDGVLAVSSPPGGPTIVAIEVPCALSSLKTSTC